MGGGGGERAGLVRGGEAEGTRGGGSLSICSVAVVRFRLRQEGARTLPLQREITECEATGERAIVLDEQSNGVRGREG